MKKKITVISLIVALIAIAVVGGSLAWFTDSDEVTNTFVIGDVDIVQNETDENGAAFEQNQTMLPIVNTTTPSADANYIDKVVTVTNTGKNDAYVRTYIAVPTSIKELIVLDVNLKNGWVQGANSGTAEIDGTDYTYYYYTYSGILAGDDNTDDSAVKTTPQLLKGVYMRADVDISVQRDKDGNITSGNFITTDGSGVVTEYPYFSTVDVVVATQGVQASGFSSAEQAITSAFENNSPWA